MIDGRITYNSKCQILSLSGGGYRGLYTAQVLELLEKKFGTHIYKHFDLISGTSIGGIIAIALGMEIPAKEIRGVIENFGPKVFSNLRKDRLFLPRLGLFRSKYDSAPLRKELSKIIGEKSTVKDLKRRVLVTSVSITSGGAGIFRTPHHESHSMNKDINLLDLALATSAAPGYFPSVTFGESDYIDGGIIANSPDLVSLLEAETFMRRSREDIFLLSIGTTTAGSALSGGQPQKRGFLGWARRHRLLEITLSSQQHLAQMLSGEALGSRYMHINLHQAPDQQRFLSLDSCNHKATATLKSMASQSVESVRDDIKLATFFSHVSPRGPWFQDVDELEVA